MGMNKYLVRIIHTEESLYLIEADTEEEAEELALYEATDRELFRTDVLTHEVVNTRLVGKEEEIK